MNDTKVLLPHIKLRFNIEHPSLEECYVNGYECALAEGSEDENPYRQGTQEYDQWLDGWWASFYGEKPLFELADYPEVSPSVSEPEAANDQSYHLHGIQINRKFFARMLKITGAIVATALVGYQIFELVA
jgi:ribosome modulation factor